MVFGRIPKLNAMYWGTEISSWLISKLFCWMCDLLISGRHYFSVCEHKEKVPVTTMFFISTDIWRDLSVVLSWLRVLEMSGRFFSSRCKLGRLFALASELNQFSGCQGWAVFPQSRQPSRLILPLSHGGPGEGKHAYTFISQIGLSDACHRDPRPWGVSGNSMYHASPTCVRSSLVNNCTHSALWVGFFSRKALIVQQGHQLLKTGICKIHFFHIVESTPGRYNS